MTGSVSGALRDFRTVVPVPTASDFNTSVAPSCCVASARTYEQPSQPSRLSLSKPLPGVLIHALVSAVRYVSSGPGLGSFRFLPNCSMRQGCFVDVRIRVVGADPGLVSGRGRFLGLPDLV